MISKEKYTTYVNLLKEELVPAMGCTEPISIAYAVAKAKKVLGENPVSAILHVSANIVKNAKSVGVMGDGRTYENTLVLRSVTTSDFMTAEWTRIPYEVLDRVSVRIVNEVPHINRIAYDITSKPPATVEWE